MKKEVKELIEKYKQDIAEERFIDIISECAGKSIENLIELRSVFNEAEIEGFDEQLSKMLINYKEITTLAWDIVRLIK